jgi:hypothetical protein
MTENQLQRVIVSIDAALAIYQQHIGPLAASELSVKSMLIVVRAQVAQQLKEMAEAGGK